HAPEERAWPDTAGTSVPGPREVPGTGRSGREMPRKEKNTAACPARAGPPRHSRPWASFFHVGAVRTRNATRVRLRPIRLQTNILAKKDPRTTGYGGHSRSKASEEAHTLGQRKFTAVVDGVGRPAHVGLPRVRTGLTPTTGVLLPTEGPTDLRTRGTDVDIDDPAVRTGRGQEPLRLTLILGEDRRGQPLGHPVVQLHCLRQGPVGDHVQNRR